MKSQQEVLGSTLSGSALAELLKRRPDLAEIELSAANSNILLPYTDLVLEILENAAAGKFPLGLDIADQDFQNVMTQLQAGTVHPALQAALQSFTLIWPEAADVRVIAGAANEWWIAIPGFRLAISSANNTLSLISLFPQTSESTDAIARQPEHVNPIVYDTTLKRAGYPWSLPFDLWTEEARLYLKELGVPRDVLMQTFYRDFSFKIPEAGPLTTAHFMTATERFGLTVAEMDIISGRRKGNGPDNDSNTGLWNFWGVSTPNLTTSNSIPDPSDSTKRIEDGFWSNLLVGPTSRVDVVLQQSGLCYMELREVLDMRYVNTTTAGQQIVELQLGTNDIVAGDPSRQIPNSNLHLAQLLKAGDYVTDNDIANLLDRLHRFVRLWRKLGWPMRELDQLAVIPSDNPTGRMLLDEGFIENLCIIKLISQLFRSKSYSELAMYDTYRYRDYNSVGEPLIDSLYERLFLNKSVSFPLDTAFALNVSRSELNNTQTPISEHLPSVAAACGLSIPDTSLLLEYIGTDSQLSLGKLSTFYMGASIARLTAISVTDLLNLCNLRVNQIAIETVWLRPESEQVISKPMELGLRFKSLARGEIKAIRYWKPKAETGEHIGHIWDLSGGPGSGVLLATVNFKAETTFGWQEQRLVQPIRIKENTDYAVSVNANTAYAVSLNSLPGKVFGSIQAEAGIELNLTSAGASIVSTVAGDSPNYFRDVGFNFYGIGTRDILLVQTTLEAGFSSAEAIYLLSHKQPSGDAEAEANAVSAILVEIRQELSSIALNVALSQDEAVPDGDAVHRELVALNWHPEVINEVFQVIQQTFSVPLAELPKKLNLPGKDQNGGCVSFANGYLITTKRLSTADSDALKALSGDVTYVAAVQALLDLPAAPFQLQAERINRDLSFFEPRNISTLLVSWPTGLTLPPDIATRFNYDSEAKQLHLIGPLDDATFARLQNLSGYKSNEPFDLALKQLRIAYATPLSSVTGFLDQDDKSNLLETLTTAADRYAFLLTKLVAHRRYVQSLKAVQNKLVTTLGLKSATVGKLLTDWLWSAVGPDQGFAISDFLQSAFVEGKAALSMTSERFPSQFKSYIRLKKVAMLVSKFKLSDTALGWLFAQTPDQNGWFGWLDPNRLPAGIDEPPVTIRPLLRTAHLCGLRDALPGGDDTLDRIFTAASDPGMDRPTLLTTVATATGWSLDELSTLVGPDGFNLGGTPLTKPDVLKTAFQDEWLMLHLLQAFAVMRRLGAKASQCLEWTKPYITRQAAADIKRLARAHFTESAWSDIAKPLQDALREKQRTALVAYLIGKYQLRDSNDLYSRYLIDVEMQPAAMTSRIKQACASVQLFVQRCLLNLEPDVTPNVIDTKLWAWMKNFRVWEANRKVFLFPENWIEPELRDDKSEFFRQLESDLLQSNVTHQTGMDALKSYVEKLGEVSRITIVSMFDEGVKSASGLRIVHIIGRDGATPHRYFYRQWLIDNGAVAGSWTAWEEVNVGIDSEHVLIFIFGGSVRIAWPTIKPDGEKGNLKIVMNLVQRKLTGWTAPKHGQEQLWWIPLKNIDISRGLIFRIDFSASDDAIIKCFGGFDVPQQTETNSPIRFEQTSDFNPSDDSRAGVFDLRIIGKHPNGNYYFFHDGQINIIINAINPDAGVGSNGKPEKKNVILRDVGYRGQLTKTILADAYIFKDITVTVVIPDGYNVLAGEAISFHADLTKVGSFNLSGDFVLSTTKSPVDNTSDSERLLSYLEIGEFEISGSGGIQTNPVTNGIPFNADVSFANVQSIYSIYREGVNPADSLAESNRTLLTSTSGRFLICQSSSIASNGDEWRTTAYSDEKLDIILWHNQTADTYYLVPSSFWWGVTLGHYAYADDLSNLINTQEATPPADQVLHVDPGGVNIGSKFTITMTEIRFETHLPMSVYNWETFFHIPLLVATQLTQNQRFEEAQRWLHLVFDPTSGQNGGDAKHFWRFKAFREVSISIEQELLDLEVGNSALKDQIAAEIEAWKQHPFQPHRIARGRHRAYQFFVLRKYLDNLIAWGDQLFQRDTIESINEATQLYILASEILGRRPLQITTHQPADVKTYSQLPPLDDFSNALVQVESLIPAVAGNGGTGNAAGAPNIYALYFGIPANQDLASYWDTVEDRLFKIRHSLNIEGVARQLPLYEPTIDPALLVRAVAAGVDIASALADLQSPLPHYRFNVMTQKALELTNDVKGFGASLLSALEKQDAENLALLRSTQEISLLKMVQTVKEKQRNEAQANVDALRKTRELISQRYLQYQRLLGNQNVTVPTEGTAVSLASSPSKAIISREAAGGDTGGLALTNEENDHLAWLDRSNNYAIASGFLHMAAGIAHAFPNITVGGPPPAPTTTYGGSYVGAALEALGSASSVGASNASYQGTRAATIGSHQRRYDEWAFQSNLAAKELEQLDKQLVAAEIRVAIAEQELANHQKQMDNAQEVDDFMHDKFTNVQLYHWMVSQAASLYFRAYQMAYDLAKRAEKSFRFELGLEDKDTNFIQFGYWDSLKKGLLAGENLGLDIKRMDVAYLDKNKRELEITRHISLRQLDAAALMSLRGNDGACEFDLPELLFDLDFPGHYFRRIKSVSISIPCVAGPYTSVSGTLTLLTNKLRNNPLASDYKADSNYRSTYLPVQSIATSSAQNDSGLFELNFRDERYLPFEGAGVISRWRFALPKQYRAFDYSTISDLVIHLHYTARDGGETLATPARNSVNTLLSSTGKLHLLLSIRQDFPDEWPKFKQNSGTPSVTVDLTDNHLFPYFARGERIYSDPIELFKVKTLGSTIVPLDVKIPAAPQITLAGLGDVSNLADLFLIVPYSMAQVKN